MDNLLVELVIVSLNAFIYQNQQPYVLTKTLWSFTVSLMYLMQASSLHDMV